MRRTLQSAGTLALATLAMGVMGPLGSPASAQSPSYAVQDLGNALAPGSSSFAHAISEDGDACGEAWIGASRVPFMGTYEHGPITLPVPSPYTQGRAFDLTERDADGIVTVIGVVTDSFYQETGDRGIWWTVSTVGGEVVDHGLIAPLPGFTEATLVAINNDRVVVGRSSGPGVQQMVHRIDEGTTTPFDFPASIQDLSDSGWICGGHHRGRLDGTIEDVGWPRSSNGASLTAVNDAGDASAVAFMPYTDGAGWFVNGLARLVGDTWQLVAANSRFDGALDINAHGDLVGVLGTSGAARPAVFLSESGSLRLVNELLGPTEQFIVDSVAAINDHGEIAAGGRAAILTPLGRMIIPGDVDGNAEVEPADLCAWRGSPIDLDGDGDADAEDEAWMVTRLESLGFEVADCDGNGVPDACDLLDGDAFDCDGNGVPDACQADCDGDGVPDACEPDCNDNAVPDDCDFAAGASEDCNDNGIPDECDGADTVSVASNLDGPIPLFENIPVEHTILVDDSGALAEVRVFLDLDYRIGQVEIRLRHAGTTVTLVERPGTSPTNTFGYSNLGYRIELADDGNTSIQSTGATCCVFDPLTSPPAYRPKDPLSAFQGLPRDGAWTLEFLGGFPQHFDPKLIGWRLELTDEAAEVGDCDCIGDLDGSGDVGVGDIGLLLAAWGTPAADLSGDGSTDAADLGVLIGAWGACE